jgi:hypothetical protein
MLGACDAAQPCTIESALDVLMEDSIAAERCHCHCKFAATSLHFGPLAMQTLS